MAFSSENMKRLNVGDESMYIYKSADAIATVAASGYFNTYTASLKKGDAIIVIDSSTPTIDVCVVSSTTGAATVTVVNGT
jgi:adenine/guanine phosphoribosyltransferase-like PRPP-binding protein